jgi:transcriptional regulator with XRE-family HTH domain
MDLPEIGKRLREARTAASRSQEEVARSLGMSRATISAIENGTVNEIGIRKVMALCAALGLELNIAAHVRPTLRDLRSEADATRNKS